MKRQSLWQRTPWVSALVIVLAAVLLLWALRAVPLQAIGQVLSQLRLSQILILLLINSVIVLLMGLRWWLLLNALGYRLPFIAITRYRLAAFGVSYFTPGPHFGGEPLQVYFVRQKHGVPGSTAVAAISMDKVLDLLVNFAFLTIGIALVINSGLILPADFDLLQAIVVGLGLAPLLYLLAIAVGLRPISRLGGRLPERWRRILRATEEQLADLARRQPAAMAQALGASLLVWGLLLFEYWLALSFLGLSVSALVVVAVLTASRLAMLAPTPGALGSLEAAQVLAMQALGLDPAYGLSLSLLVHARDVLFGAIGLWWGGLGRG